MNKYLLYYGGKAPLPEKVKLKAGRLDMMYENGFLRNIRLGKYEILRMINHAVRDYNWGTAPFKITDEKIQAEANSFKVKYKAEVKQGQIDFIWYCNIIGNEDSSIQFTIEGEALSSFKRNRIGFTVLHPVNECIGQPLKITHPDSSSSVINFPELIHPGQPFKNIEKIEWSLDKIVAQMDFKGEVFESEDQRNWIDDSYKIYGTPIDLPFPVPVEKGDKISQEINLKLNADLQADTEEKSVNEISIDFNPIELPNIGICHSSEVETLNSYQTASIGKVAFDFYQADLFLYQEEWTGRWNQIKSAVESLGLPLELSIFLHDVNKELSAFKNFVKSNSLDIYAINIFNKTQHATQSATLKKALPQLREMFPQAKIGAGTNAFFTELNRDRTPSDGLDFLVYSTNPQVHAFDNESLCESLNAIPYTIKTAKAFSGQKPVHISPVTLKMRWNPNATGEAIEIPGQLPDDVDPRQMSLFAASWLLGAINNLIAEEPEAVSFFETVGLKGILQSSSPIFSELFPVPPDYVYPVFIIFKKVLENKSARFFRVKSSNATQFTGLAWGNDKPETLVLANLQLKELSIHLPSEFHYGSWLEINAGNIEMLMRNQDWQSLNEKNHSGSNVTLPPYGITLFNLPN